MRCKYSELPCVELPTIGKRPSLIPYTAPRASQDMLIDAIACNYHAMYKRHFGTALMKLRLCTEYVPFNHENCAAGATSTCPRQCQECRATPVNRSALRRRAEEAGSLRLGLFVQR